MPARGPPRARFSAGRSPWKRRRAAGRGIEASRRHEHPTQESPRLWSKRRRVMVASFTPAEPGPACRSARSAKPQAAEILFLHVVAIQQVIVTQVKLAVGHHRMG